MPRPSKYNDEMQAKAEGYLVDCPDVVPSNVGLAVELGIAESTLYLWGDVHPEFSETLAAIQTHQHRDLLNGGLSGAHNSTIAKLMLSNHGYSDKVDTTLSGGPGGPVKVEPWTVDATSQDSA